MAELKPLTTFKHTTDILHKLVEEEHWSAENAMFFLNTIPDADVAPKSEVERWRRNLEAVLEERAETKQEVAMEIFEDLESMIYEHGVINCHKLAELTKKYTEERV
jgi:hypothetical protein